MSIERAEQENLQKEVMQSIQEGECILKGNEANASFSETMNNIQESNEYDDKSITGYFKQILGINLDGKYTYGNSCNNYNEENRNQCITSYIEQLFGNKDKIEMKDIFGLSHMEKMHLSKLIFHTQQVNWNMLAGSSINDLTDCVDVSPEDKRKMINNKIEVRKIDGREIGYYKKLTYLDIFTALYRPGAKVPPMPKYDNMTVGTIKNLVPLRSYGEKREHYRMGVLEEMEYGEKNEEQTKYLQFSSVNDDPLEISIDAYGHSNIIHHETSSDKVSSGNPQGLIRKEIIKSDKELGECAIIISNPNNISKPNNQPIVIKGYYKEGYGFTFDQDSFPKDKKGIEIDEKTKTVKISKGLYKDCKIAVQSKMLKLEEQKSGESIRITKAINFGFAVSNGSMTIEEKVAGADIYEAEVRNSFELGKFELKDKNKSKIKGSIREITNLMNYTKKRPLTINIHSSVDKTPVKDGKSFDEALQQQKGKITKSLYEQVKGKQRLDLIKKLFNEGGNSKLKVVTQDRDTKQDRLITIRKPQNNESGYNESGYTTTDNLSTVDLRSFNDAVLNLLISEKVGEIAKNFLNKAIEIYSKSEEQGKLATCRMLEVFSCAIEGGGGAFIEGFLKNEITINAIADPYDSQRNALISVDDLEYQK